MYRTHHGCIQIRNLPYHWVGEPEKAAQTLRGILYGVAQLQVCCSQMDPRNVHQGMHGLLRHSYANVWVTSEQVDNYTLSNITSITLGGVHLEVYKFQLGTDKKQPPKSENEHMDLNHDRAATELHPQCLAEVGKGVCWTQGRVAETTVPSMWSDPDLFKRSS